MGPRDVLVIVVFVIAAFTIGPALCGVFADLADALTAGQPAVNRFLARFLMEFAASGLVIGLALSAVGRRSALPGGAIGAAVLALVGAIFC